MPKKKEDTLYADDVISISSGTSRSKSNTALSKLDFNKKNSQNNSPICGTPEMITSPKFNTSESRTNVTKQRIVSRKGTEKLPKNQDEFENVVTKHHTYTRTTSLMI